MLGRGVGEGSDEGLAVTPVGFIIPAKFKLCWGENKGN